MEVQIIRSKVAADTVYFNQFSCRDELQLRNKLSRVGGWVGLLEKWRIRLSSASTGFELGLWLSLAIIDMYLVMSWPCWGSLECVERKRKGKRSLTFSSSFGYVDPQNRSA